MKTIRKEKLYWICQVGGWLLFTMIEMLTYGSFDHIEQGWLTNVFINLVLCILITHLYRLFLIKSGWLNLPLFKLIPRGVLAVILMSLVMVAINIPLDRYTYPLFQDIPFSVTFFMGYFINVSKYLLLWALTYHLFQYWERSLEAEKERYRLTAMMKENAYNNLKLQLNPHFLFNSLNSIRTLVDINPEMSKQAITQLSGLLRSSLHMGKHKTVALRDELQTVKDYLAIETIRFDTRLKTEFHVDENAWECHVPPMMLQTLVENAVKHGISSLKHGGLIRLDIHKNATALHIDIVNTGQYNPDSRHNGVGIGNTMERLELLYDERATFEIGNKDNQHVATHITIPFLQN